MDFLVEMLGEFPGALAQPEIIGCLALIACLLAVFNRNGREVTRRSLGDFWNGFLTGLGGGWRGYFAPVRTAPWKSAWRAFRAPGATSRTVFMAWFEQIDRIVRGKK